MILSYQFSGIVQLMNVILELKWPN